MHLSSAFRSPISYQPGPDEDYYQRFGAAVASGSGANGSEFTFMDPGYGFLLGGIFKLTGVNPFAVYLLQLLLDCATVYGILLAGRLLGRPRAGMFGAVSYAVAATAIMFCATLLKETAVAAVMTWWVVYALCVRNSRAKIAWAVFGVLCGLGIALRSTLALLGLAGVLWAAMPGAMGESRQGMSPRSVKPRWIEPALVVAGMVLALWPLSLRNEHAFGSASPLPHNGGIVLHQAYNMDNPASSLWIPPFVDYLNPSEIWRGYAAEAQRREGRSLAPREVDDYWRDQALLFMREHPRWVLADVWRKGAMFLASSEIPNNRDMGEEREFSPLLAWLPPPMPWLVAMGLVGLVWLAIQDRRWVIVAVPIGVSWLTMAAFWAEDRFRFHALPMLALTSGVWIDGMISGFRDRGTAAGRYRAAVGLAGMAALLALSLWLGARHPAPAVRPDHAIWGYIKMGNPAAARALAERSVVAQPDNEPVLEALGYLAARTGNYADAIRYYRSAVKLRPHSHLAHFNLAKSLLEAGDGSGAAAEATEAMKLSPSADTQKLLERAEALRATSASSP